MKQVSFVAIVCIAVLSTPEIAQPKSDGESAAIGSAAARPAAMSGSCGAGQLCLAVTASLDPPPACGASDTLEASFGDLVNYCYTITNNTGVDLDYHTLSDDINGNIFSLLSEPVPAGGTYQYNRLATAYTTQTLNSVWTGQDVLIGYTSERESDGGAITDRIFCDGFDGSAAPCANDEGHFIDITGTGIPLGLGDEDSVDLPMPFSFDFYATTSNLLTVSNNGGAFFNTPGALLYFENAALPDSHLFGPVVLPLWDDFDGSSGDVYYDTRGVTPNRQFIVEWFNRVHYPGQFNTDSATFELIINEDGTIQFEYADVAYTANAQTGPNPDPEDCTGGLCATIGMQNDASLYSQFSAFAASVADNSGIKWTPNAPPQVFTGAASVTIDVGQPEIDVQPPTLSGTVPSGGKNSITFTIENHGNRDLIWSLGEGEAAILARRSLPLNKLPFGSGVPVFAADASEAHREFITFDAQDPGVTTHVGDTGTTAYALDFVNDDFSKVYGIDQLAAQFDTFGTIDTATGQITPIGMSNTQGDLNGFTAFRYDRTTSRAYAAATTCGSSSHLYTIDINTGASTLVGELIGMPCALAIAIDPNGQMYGLDITNEALYAIDKTTGNATFIGSIGFDAISANQAMDFDDLTGTLYYASIRCCTDDDEPIDEMRTVNVTTGATTVIGLIGDPNGDPDYFRQIVGLAIGTTSDRCSPPQDLPWLSLDPPEGTTQPDGASTVTASLNGTGFNEGDVLTGVVCVTSNDPDEHLIEMPIAVTVGGGGEGTIIDSGVLNYSIPQDGSGLYITWLTGCVFTSEGGSCPTTDFNPYGMPFSGLLQFSWPTITSNCVASDSTYCDVLASGSIVGPASTYSWGGASNFAAGNTDGYLGFSFVNADTGQVNYGYALLTSTAPEGSPATLVEYWYDNSGTAITIP